MELLESSPHSQFPSEGFHGFLINMSPNKFRMYPLLVSWPCASARLQMLRRKTSRCGISTSAGWSTAYHVHWLCRRLSARWRRGMNEASACRALGGVRATRGKEHFSWHGRTPATAST